MAINFSTYLEILNRIQADISSKTDGGLDPRIINSDILAIAESTAGRHFDNQLLMKQVLDQLFPQTAESFYLELWALYEDLERLAATPSTGPITMTGVVGTLIPQNTQLSSQNGNTYFTQNNETVANISASVTTLVRSGSIVTGTTASDHQMATGLLVTISGANETDYNGSFEVTVTDTDEFTYEIATTPSSPATGTISADFDGVTVEIESNEPGADQNLASGGQINLVTPITDIDDEGYVQYAGLVGGTDDESDDDLLSRTEQSRSNPIANFNSAAIEKEARKLGFVDKVKVKPITPEEGDVTILFTRKDTGSGIIPNSGEVTLVKDQIMEIAPANTGPAQVFVSGPTPITTNYVFSSITPDTPGMRTAIENNLNAMYEDDVDFEETILEDKYRGVIISSVDLDTGDTLTAFTLSSPSGDITVSTGQIAVLGTITFS